MKWFFLGLSLILFSCDKRYLNVKRERVDRFSLASSYVNSPDPLQTRPPLGQRLLIEWRLPLSSVKKGLILTLHVIYRNNSEAYFHYPIEKHNGSATYELLGDEFLLKKGLLSYQATVRNFQGDLIKEWTQALYVQLIEPSSL
ncbi:MAG: hypothetical protein WDZ28_01765 [Simkaniaceae bacterium]